MSKKKNSSMDCSRRSPVGSTSLSRPLRSLTNRVLEVLYLDKIHVSLQVFFSTQFTSFALASCMSCNKILLRFVYQWCSLDLCIGTVCHPGPRDQLQLGTSVLSRSSPSSLLLALCTARAIRVIVRLMGFTRIRFCVRGLDTRHLSCH